MFFADGVKSFFAGIFGTHPPLKERISRIESRRLKASSKSSELSSQEALAIGFNSANRLSKRSPMPPSPLINERAISHSSLFIKSLPSDLQHAIREPFSSRAVIFAMFLSDNKAQRENQLRLIGERVDYTLITFTRKILAQLSSIGRHHYIPLIDLMTPALKQMSKEQKAAIFELTKKLITSDSKVDFLEYTYLTILRRSLFDKSVDLPRKELKKLPTPLAAAKLLSAITLNSHDKKEHAVRAYQKAARSLSFAKDLASPIEVNVFEFDRSLRSLNRLSYKHKKKLIEACVQAIQHDGRILEIEKAFIRGISDALGCPSSFFSEERPEDQNHKVTG